jgi:hypothetical protein
MAGHRLLAQAYHRIPYISMASAHADSSNSSAGRRRSGRPATLSASFIRVKHVPRLTISPQCQERHMLRTSSKKDVATNAISDATPTCVSPDPLPAAMEALSVATLPFRLQTPRPPSPINLRRASNQCFRSWKASRLST